MDDAPSDGPIADAPIRRNILLTAQWDGTDFAGWQHQPDQRTVQQTLTEALESMVHHPVDVFASSRTDSGVHARAMPVSFETMRTIAPMNFVKGLGTILPHDLSVVAAREIEVGWRPRDAAVAKTYTYRLQLGARRAIPQRYTWWLGWRPIDLERMREAAQHYLGEHDFGAFRSAQCDAHTTKRRMYKVEVPEPDDDGIVALRVTGNAFLRNMVRIMTGALVEVGCGRRKPEWIAELLVHGDRTKNGPTAPARGLTLTEVHFEGYPRLGKREPAKEVT